MRRVELNRGVLHIAGEEALWDPPGLFPAPASLAPPDQERLQKLLEPVGLDRQWGECRGNRHGDVVPFRSRTDCAPIGRVRIVDPYRRFN